jgi:hypothetical protein
MSTNRRAGVLLRCHVGVPQSPAMLLPTTVPPIGMAVALRNARVLHACFLLAALLDIVTLVQIHPPRREVSSTIVYALAFECIVVAGLAMFIGRRRVHVAEEKLRINPGDAVALRHWRTGLILSWVFAESIVLIGFLVKFLGADWRTAGPFFAFGIMLMLLWTPRLDVPSQS